MKKGKTSQLQIRVTHEEKALIKAAARNSGEDISSWVLKKLVSGHHENFLKLCEDLEGKESEKFDLAAIHDFIHDLSGNQIATLPMPRIEKIPPNKANYLAALIELAANSASVMPPSWVFEVPPLETPMFGTELKSLRIYLLSVSPVPFRQRNIFIDATLGDRV